MISNVELQYVGQTAQNVPYPGREYALDVMQKLDDAIKIYKNKYENKFYSLILSNGEEIHFAVKEKNLAHILGVDYKGLISDNMVDLTKSLLGFAENERVSSYEVLLRLLENADTVLKNDSFSTNPRKLLNYYKLMVKCTSFSKLSNFEEFNFGFINFDKDVYQNINQCKFAPTAEKFIFTASDEALVPYCMMGIVLDNEDNTIYVPQTLMAPVYYGSFMNNQELLVPVQLLINNAYNLSKHVAKPEEKLRILNMYRSIISQCGIMSSINIYNDYESILRQNAIDEKAKQYTR